jgi:radical SAM protein with 4Fe4S-binding SPASM domain
LFERLIPHMGHWQRLCLSAASDCVSDADLERILLVVRDHSDCTVNISTCGILINPELAEVCVREGVDEVSICLDSLEKERYEAWHVNARFDAVLEGIDCLVQAKHNHGSTLPRLNLASSFSRRNIDELADLIKFAHEKGFSTVQATPTQVCRRSWVKDSLLYFPALTRKTVQTAETLAAQLGISFINDLRMVYVNRGRGPLSFLKQREPVDFPTDPSLCAKPWTSVYIEPDGRLRPCRYLGPVYGSLHQKSFTELWNGAEARSLRSWMKEKDPPSVCRDCYEFNRDNPAIMIPLDLEYQE